jgi:uncharacterized RDD family membrane protein YckC
MAVYKFAGFWRRLVAYIVDYTIINIIFFILAIIVTIAFILGSLSGNSRNWMADLANPAHLTFLVLPAMVFYIAISIAYFTYFHGIKGRTPGKMLLGLKVLSTDGTLIGFGIAFLRSVGYLVSSILYIGFIWAAFDRRKQGWHDKIAGTVVVILPRENQVAGLIIPEPQVVLTVSQTGESQSKTYSRAAAQPSEPTAGENKEIADQPRVDDQKIP